MTMVVMTLLRVLAFESRGWRCVGDAIYHTVRLNTAAMFGSLRHAVHETGKVGTSLPVKRIAATRQAEAFGVFVNQGGIIR